MSAGRPGSVPTEPQAEQAFADASPRSTERFAAKREAILDAAARVFNAKGIRGGTLSDVAASVGLATNSVTYYYRRHEELAAACLLRSIDALDRALDGASGKQTVAERVEALFAGYLDILAAIRRGRHPELITFADMRAIGAPHSQTIFSAYNATSKRARQLLIDKQTESLSKDELSARNYLLVSEVSWTRLWTPLCEADEFDIIARRMSDLVLRGLHMPGSAWAASQPEGDFWSTYQDLPAIADPFLCATAALVNQHGFHGASIDRIAAHLNLTKGAFYGRGSNKDELIAACFEKKSLVMQLAWQGCGFGTGTGWERLCTAMRRMVWLQLSGLGPLLRTTAILAVPGDDFQKSVRQIIEQNARQISNTLIDGMMDGSIRPCDPVLGAHYLGGAIDHAAGVSGWARSVTVDNALDKYLKPTMYGLLDLTIPAASQPVDP